MNNPYDFKDVYVELHGQKRLYIENYKKLLKYTQTEIIIQTSRGKLILKGSHLYIRKYCYDEIQIDGIAEQISFHS